MSVEICDSSVSIDLLTSPRVSFGGTDLRPDVGCDRRCRAAAVSSCWIFILSVLLVCSRENTTVAVVVWLLDVFVFLLLVQTPSGRLSGSHYPTAAGSGSVLGPVLLLSHSVCFVPPQQSPHFSSSVHLDASCHCRCSVFFSWLHIS